MYPLSQHGAPGLEHSRLALLEECHDPLSGWRLDAIGVEEGWRCLDVGAGGGSVTKMLAERAGTTGSVLAIDLDTGLLDVLASDRIGLVPTCTSSTGAHLFGRLALDDRELPRQPSYVRSGNAARW